MLSPLFLIVALATDPAPAVHRVSIDIRGALALVEVERSLPAVGDPGVERVLDLALPPGAALAGAEVAADGRGRLRLQSAGDATQAREEHARALLVVGASGTHLPLEDGTDYRLHLGIGAGARTLVHYRYTAPLACRRGRFVLAVPGSLEPEPVPAEVTVRAPGVRVADLQVGGTPVRPGSRSQAPARAPWELSFTIAGRAGEGHLLASVGSGATTAGRTMAVGLCGGSEDDGTARPGPERLLLLMDRSRSVGPAGIVLERDLARALLEALPPSVRFNAIFFDRRVAPLFALPRAATTEALTALAEETGPGQLQNGTDLPRALRMAAEMARGERTRTWIAVITDGALPEEQTPATVLAAAADLPAETRTLVLLVRPGGDEPAAPAAQAALRALPARFGGVLRTADPADLRAAAVQAAAAMRRGGDLFALALAPAGQAPVEAVPMLTRGRGEAQLVRWPAGHLPVSASVRLEGAPRSLPLHAAPVAASWMAPLAAGKRPAWQGEGPRMAAWIEPAAEPETAADETARGQMDRGVVRNALSLAYLPRARACYLSRPVRTAADQELRGRLRLELTLERGEMLEAVVRGSTLGRPEIETCLREAAFGIEIPRPLHRDAPVVAAMNLQFQPHTTSAAPDASPVDREIDLIIGPVGPSDPLDLLAAPAASGKEGPGSRNP
jgi:hypothetical protein